MIEAQEAERRHLDHELHDEIGQALTAVKINLQALQRSVASSHQTTLPFQESIDIVEVALQQVRGLSLDLRPSLLDDLGLIAALRWYIDRQTQRAGISGELIAELETKLSPNLETICFRIVQEAITNVVRHAKAQRVTVELQQWDTQLQLIIRDDGVGFDIHVAREQATSGGSLGLLGMEERVLLVGGYIKIESAHQHGTKIHVQFPISI